jgi:hypothetical protein
VTGGKIYYLAVDGSNGAVGTIPVECLIGQEPPAQTNAPALKVIELGQNVVLTAGSPAVSGPVPTYQWLENSLPLSGATGAELTVTPKGLADAGLYSVVIDNGIGRVTNAVAQVGVHVPLVLGESAGQAPHFEGEEFVFGFGGNAGQDVGIDQSLDLATWTRSGSVWLSEQGLGQYRDGQGKAAVGRMYRAVEIAVQVVRQGSVVKNGQANDEWAVTGGQVGQRYVVEQSADGGVSWTPVQTNQVQAADWHFEVPSNQKLTERVSVLQR